MKLLGKLEMRSPRRIAEFLEAEHVGRIATIDENGYPQVIPMNFAFVGGFVYMHSHVRGEKLDNIRRNEMAGFEVDRELEFCHHTLRIPPTRRSPTPCTSAS